MRFHLDYNEITALFSNNPEDVFWDFEFGICECRIHSISVEDAIEILDMEDNDAPTQLKLKEATGDGKTLIQVELGFGHNDLEYMDLNNEEIDEIFIAEKCAKIEIAAYDFLAKYNRFIHIRDFGLCPGFSFQITAIEEINKLYIVLNELNILLNKIEGIEQTFTKEFFLKNYLLTVDKLRVVTTNTQLRYLPILGEILKEISKELRPISLVKNSVLKWSLNLFESESNYKRQSGILHKQGSKGKAQPTGAFEHYVMFLVELGLIVKINDFVRCTKNGILYLELTKDINNKNEERKLLITDLFFKYWIVNSDADAIFLILQAIGGEIKLNTKPKKGEVIYKTEKLLRDDFAELLVQRIQGKAKFANSIARNLLQQRYISITRLEFIHKQKGIKLTASEKHSVPPRLAWLSRWGLIKQGTSKELQVTDKGIFLLSEIPILPQTSYRDIIDQWMFNDFFSILPQLSDIQANDFKEIGELGQRDILDRLLDDAFEWQNDGALRLSYYPTLLFICLKCLLDYNLIVTFKILNDTLKNFTTKNKTYILHLTPSLSESYISINLN